MTRSASSFRPVSMMKNEEIDRVPRHDPGDLPSARERRDPDVVVAEVVDDHLAHRWIVIDRQHMGCNRHSRRLPDRRLDCIHLEHDPETLIVQAYVSQCTESWQSPHDAGYMWQLTYFVADLSRRRRRRIVR